MTDKPVVCLLTDFGLSDNYVGAMKAVLLKAVSDIQIVDLTHGVPPHDVRAGAFLLMTAWGCFPPGTLFIGVVDPGVGTERKILYIEAGAARFLVPDNGLVSWTLETLEPSMVIGVNTGSQEFANASRTFHGRDIIAPVAGRLLKGESPAGLGAVVSDWVKIPFPRLKKTGTLWEAEIIYADRFGNLVTNIPSADLMPLAQSSQAWFSWDGGQSSLRGVVSSYADKEKGALLALAGSHGFIEIAVREGSAAERTGLSVGSPIALQLRV